jgi:hypothetical protein
MADLSPKQIRFLERVRREQRWTAVLGALLTLSGALYLAWGIARFDPRGDPKLDPGFDRPVADLAHLYDTRHANIKKIRPETFNEEVLMETIALGINFNTGILMLLMRIFLGTLTLVGGLVMLTVVVERRRLLLLVDRLSLREPQ